MNPRQILVVVALLTCLHPAPSALGQQGSRHKRKLAFTDPKQADADFAIQGEYMGWIAGSCGRRHTGLQVVARGDGRFEGIQYGGGLPGSGWDRGTPRRLTGQRQGDIAALGDGQRQITIQRGVATLRHAGRGMLGTLKKVRRTSSTLGARPPWGATTLFDGTTADYLQGAQLTEEGLLNVGVTTTMPVHDFHLHVEFRTPYMPYARGQGRGNSGVYIQRRYEIQILDSFGLEGRANECGGIYRQHRPQVNMCLPPLSWQTYDIHFTAARWNRYGAKICNARITVLHNGVVIHASRELYGKTGAGRPESPQPLPIHFQNHGNPVVFRNMWIVHRGYRLASAARCPLRGGLFRRLVRR